MSSIGNVGIVVEPVFLATMRKTTLLPMLTGLFVGLSKVFVIVNAGCVIVTEARPLLVVAPELVPAVLVTFAAAVAVKNTLMLVLCPGVSVPRFVQDNELEFVTFGAGDAVWKVMFADGKLSSTTTFGRVVLPVLITCNLNWMVSPTSALALAGETRDLLIARALTPGGGNIVAVAVDWSVGSFASV